MPEPMVDKSVDENLAAEAEKLLAQEVESAGETVPTQVAAAETEADLSAEVEKLLAQQTNDGATEGLDADLAALTQTLLAEDQGAAAVSEPAEATETEEDAEAADATAEQADAEQADADASAEANAGAASDVSRDVPVEVPGDVNGEATLAGGAAQVAAVTPAADAGQTEQSQAGAPEAKVDEAKPQATEEELHNELDAAAQQVEIPPAPEPTLPPAEAVGKAAAESIAAKAEASKPAKPAAAAAKETKGATLEDLKPSFVSKLFKPLGAVSGAAVGALALLSKPLADKPSVVRDSIGWLSVSTLFCGASLWGYALVFRKPPEPPKPHDPVALVETADAGHVTYAKRSESGAAGGHGEAKESPKKDEAKKDAGHGAAKKSEPKKTEAKKTDAKKADASHGGGH